MNNFITYLIFNVLLVIEQFQVGNLIKKIIIEEISSEIFSYAISFISKISYKNVSSHI